MKRIDLIISVIEDCLTDFATDDYGDDYRPCCGVYINGKHKDDCKLQQALAAARELKALKPMAWLSKDNRFTTYIERTDENWTPLIALDEGAA